LGQVGGERIAVEELAHRAGSITQEIMARMGSRLPRVYRHEEHRHEPGQGAGSRSGHDC
jgi:hypothetical protein